MDRFAWQAPEMASIKVGPQRAALTVHSPAVPRRPEVIATGPAPGTTRPILSSCRKESCGVGAPRRLRDKSVRRTVAEYGFAIVTRVEGVGHDQGFQVDRFVRWLDGRGHLSDRGSCCPGVRIRFGNLPRPLSSSLWRRRGLPPRCPRLHGSSLMAGIREPVPIPAIEADRIRFPRPADRSGG